mmetsp:Transcript_44838/g.91533  ORF Transcript_44838/g.91533 Transcript_44838/m.91533 type:complete len:370 (+) Transcript_44838:162-1271(+)
MARPADHSLTSFTLLELLDLCLRVGAGNNLGNLLRDGGLALPVHLTRQVGDKVRGVVRCRLHGSHTRRKLRGDRLLHLAEELAVEIEGEDGGEDLLRVLLEDHVLGEHLGRGRVELGGLNSKLAILGRHGEDLIALRLDTGRGQGKHGADRGLRRDERGEARVEELDAVGVAGKVGREQRVRDLRRLLGSGSVADGHSLDDVAALLEVGRALGANAEGIIGDARRLELVHAGLGLLDRVRVVAAAEAAVASHHDKEHLVNRALVHEGRVEVVLLEALDEAAEDLLQGLRERAGLEHSVLGPANLGGSDKPHGRGDLLGVLHRGHAVTEVLDAHNGARSLAAGSHELLVLGNSSTTEGRRSQGGRGQLEG